jgi:hypothetical protein
VRKVSIGLGALAAVAALATPASALAAQTLVIKPTVQGKLGGPAKIGLGFTITADSGIPSPLAGPFIESIPKGITFSAAGFKTCPMAVIQAATGSAPPNCPASSKMGAGTSVTQALIGSSPLVENGTIYAYLTKASPISIGFWGNGTTPIETTVTFNGVLSAASGLFGNKLSTLTPVIPTVPGGPDASTTQFQFLFGGSAKVKGKTVTGITLPKKCTGVMHWAATSSYQDGTSNSTTATTPCPKK